MEERFATREEMKAEALKNMKALGLMRNVIKEFEERTGDLVYHVIHNMTNFGEMYSMLIISKYKEDWDVMCQGFKGGQFRVFSYVYNKTDPMMSDMGSILVKPSIGGLRRTA